MDKIKTLIVDDEPLALSILKAKLSKCPDIEIIGECRNGREAIQAVQSLEPDLLFLDIHMPGLDGFDVIKQLQGDLMPLIVFCTAYEQFALDAFNVNAVDYILKPIDQQRVDRAVERARQRLGSEENRAGKPAIIKAIDSIQQTAAGQQNPAATQQAGLPGSSGESVEHKIVIKERDEITLLKQADIAWVDAAGDYCCLHANDITHIKRITLKDLLQELDSNVFKRVHRSTIVNLNYIEKVIPHTKGEFFLQLGEFDRIKVSRNYKEAIRSFITDNRHASPK